MSCGLLFPGGRTPWRSGCHKSRKSRPPQFWQLSSVCRAQHLPSGDCTPSPGAVQISLICAACTAHSIPYRITTMQPFVLIASKQLRSKHPTASNAALPSSVAHLNARSSGGGECAENQFVPLPSRLICCDCGGDAGLVRV